MRERLAAIAGLVAGLGLGAPLGLSAPPAPLIFGASVAAMLLWRSRLRSGSVVTVTRAGALCAVAALAGVWIAAERVAAIDAGAFRAAPGTEARVRGFVEAVPRRDGGEVDVRVDTGDGRLLVRVPEPVADLPVGGEVVASGIVRHPSEWERSHLARQGVAAVLEAGTIERTRARRGGAAALADELRRRAEGALGRGTTESQAALLRGFVLGQDDRIEAGTVEEFQRSGLAHLLAVSGQNVLLLGLLVTAVLALAGVGHRARLLAVLALIAVYVPVAGAGPSIQRAGVMGAAGVIAALASRPVSRWYATLLAAAATLVLNPRAGGDVGWQLSFAAVIGIALWAAPLRRLFAGGDARRGPRAALAEGAAVTVAAAAATAPLMAFHFERLSLATLAANLAALPAVAPVMWLGMLAAAVGQVPWLPVEPLTGLAGLCSAYIAQVAAWSAAPAWAEAEVALPGHGFLAFLYAAMALSAWVLTRAGARIRGLRARLPGALPAALALALAVTAALALRPGGDGPPRAALTVRVLDAGQGDAILLSPRRADPVLVDTGPASGGVAGRLAELGVDRLAAVLVTHDQSDHAGGLAGVLERIDVGMVAWGAPDRDLEATTEALGAQVAQVAAGSSLASGPLRLEILWPPVAMVDEPSRGEGDDPNLLSVVALARWRGFRILLTGDAEAEATGLEPGPVDVIKLAHHGSADGGLASLLARSSPDLAVASVGEGNPFGHPAPETVSTLAEAGVPLLRTDKAGEIVIAAQRSGWTVHPSE